LGEGAADVIGNRRLKQNTIRSINGIFFILPCAVILVMMMFTPVIRTIVFSFSKVTLPSFDIDFIGIDNFRRIFSSRDLLTVLRNTLYWTVASVSMRLLFGMLSALVMNNQIKGIGVLRVIALLPWTVPSIVSSNMWRWILQTDYGLLNGTLRGLGFEGLAKSWLGSSSTALPSVVFAATWASYPFVMMMILSAMQNIPNELYESARIDGANGWHLFSKITLPSIKPVIFVVTTLEIISSINAFDMLFTMTGGGPGNSSEILVLYVYRLSFTSRDYGAASAVSTALLIFFSFIFIFYAPKQTKKG